jgi:hypothetical protein
LQMILNHRIQYTGSLSMVLLLAENTQASGSGLQQLPIAYSE